MIYYDEKGAWHIQAPFLSLNLMAIGTDVCHPSPFSPLLHEYLLSIDNVDTLLGCIDPLSLQVVD